MDIQKPVLVSDMGGVLYSFSPNLDSVEHEELFGQAMKTLGLEGASVKQQLRGELEAINRGLLNVYPNKSGVANLVKNENQYSVVIVSTSLEETSKLILRKLGINEKVQRVFDMSDFGSKKDPMSWEKIFNQLPSVDAVVEDGQKNLESAINAARNLGHSPQSYPEMPLLENK